jgi:hypothetical protein
MMFGARHRRLIPLLAVILPALFPIFAFSSDNLSIVNAANLVVPGISFLTTSGAAGIAPGTVAFLSPFGSLGNLSATETSAVRAEIFIHGTFGAAPLTILNDPVLTQLRLPGVFVKFPLSTPLGRATVTLRVPPDKVFSGTVDIVRSNFKIAQYGPPLWVLPIPFPPRTSSNLLAQPAKPGDEITLLGSGLGLADREELKVLLNARPYPVLATMPASGPREADQVRFKVPDDAALPTGCYVNIQTQVGDVVSNPVVFSISRDGQPCEHPLGLTGEELALLDSGRSIPVGTVTINSQIEPVSYRSDIRFLSASPSDLIRSEDSLAEFTRETADGLERRFANKSDFAPNEGCSLEPFNFFDFFRPLSFRFLSFFPNVFVGDTVTEVGPTGRWLQLEAAKSLRTTGVDFFGSYFSPTDFSDPVADAASLPAAIFSAGDLELRIPGSDAVPTSTVRTRLPGPAMLTNFNRLTPIDTSRDLTITWDPQNFTERELVDFSLDSLIIQDGEFLYLRCILPAKTGKGVVPATLLRKFQPTGGTLEESTVRFSRVAASPVEPVKYLQLSDGTRMAVLFNFNSSHTIPVKLR